MIKKISLLTAALLVVSLAFFGCDDREFSGTAPAFDPLEFSLADGTLDPENDLGTSGPIEVDDDGWFTIDNPDGTFAMIFYVLPAGFAVYDQISFTYESEAIDSGAPGMIMKNGNYSAVDISFGGPPNSDERANYNYPKLKEKGTLGPYPLSEFSRAIVGMQQNVYNDGDSFRFKVRFTSILINYFPEED